MGYHLAAIIDDFDPSLPFQRPSSLLARYLVRSRPAALV